MWQSRSIACRRHLQGQQDHRRPRFANYCVHHCPGTVRTTFAHAFARFVVPGKRERLGSEA